jgi:hypothetical protein
MQMFHSDDKAILHRAHHSVIAVRTLLRAGSKDRRSKPLTFLLPGLILFAAAAPPWVGAAHAHPVGGVQHIIAMHKFCSGKSSEAQVRSTGKTCQTTGAPVAKTKPVASVKEEVKRFDPGPRISSARH